MEEKSIPTESAQSGSEPSQEPQSRQEVAPRLPSERSRIFGAVLRWGAVILGVFILGVIVSWIVLVRPVSAELKGLQAEHEAALATLEALNEEVSTLQPLQGQLSRSEQHIVFLRILNDVGFAQLSMAQSDPTAARAALMGAEDRLISMGQVMTGDEAESLGRLSERLGLVLEELDDNAFAARRLLEILVNDMLTFERGYFGQ